MTTPLQLLIDLRATYPTPMSNDEIGALLNAVAWMFRADGWGLLKKPTGAYCLQPVTHIRVSRDILCRIEGPDLLLFDALRDSEGTGVPTWGRKKPLQDLTRWVAPVGSGVNPPPPEPDRPEPRPVAALKPYDDAFAVDFGQAVNRLYAGSDRPVDAGMVAVQAMRAWHDYQAGLSWPASCEKHVAEFKQAAGL
jgi:hypothetical protein